MSGERRRGFDWNRLLESTVIVALLTLAAGAFTQSGSDDVKRCEIATNFLIDDSKDATLLPADEWREVVRGYARLARASCEGME